MSHIKRLLQAKFSLASSNSILLLVPDLLKARKALKRETNTLDVLTPSSADDSSKSSADINANCVQSENMIDVQTKALDKLTDSTSGSNSREKVNEENNATPVLSSSFSSCGKVDTLDGGENLSDISAQTPTEVASCARSSSTAKDTYPGLMLLDTETVRDAAYLQNWSKVRIAFLKIAKVTYLFLKFWNA